MNIVGRAKRWIKAQKRGNALMTETLRLGRQNPNRNILIINSNTNQKASRCRHLLDQAEKSGFETEVYRLHNFYPNLHGVKEHDVLAAYIKLNKNRVANEIHIEAVQPASAEQLEKIKQMQAFEQQPLPFDEAQQTFVTEHYPATRQPATLPPKHPSAIPNYAC